MRQNLLRGSLGYDAPAMLTRRGTTSDMRLPKGWLAVGEAFKLPLPDTSWMEAPPRREDWLCWTSSPE